MSIVALILVLLFLGIVGLIVLTSVKMWKKAAIKDKETELRLVNEMADEVTELEQELKPELANKKRNKINKFTKT